MIKIYLLLIIITFSNINAQNCVKEKIKIEYSDAYDIFYICNNQINIDYKNEKEYYWYSKDLHKQGTTKGGKAGFLLDGKMQTFNLKGNLIGEVNFKSGLRHGEYKYWDSEGEILEFGSCLEGELTKSKSKTEEGWVEFDYTNKEEFFLIKKFYTKYDVLSSKESFNFIEQDITTYYSDGKTIELFFKKNSIFKTFTGVYKEFYNNGKPKFIGHFSEKKYYPGIRTGKWIWYNENGSITDESLYKIDSVRYTYSDELMHWGSRIYDENNDTWVKSGKWYYYNTDGKLLREEEYEFGKLKE